MTTQTKTIEDQCKQAYMASKAIVSLNSKEKNDVLSKMIHKLKEHEDTILQENLLMEISIYIISIILSFVHVLIYYFSKTEYPTKFYIKLLQPKFDLQNKDITLLFWRTSKFQM